MQIDITLEQALERCSKGLKEKLLYSVGLMQRAERLALMYDEGGYYLAMSFGKDSQALFHAAQLAGVKFHAVFNPTSVDPPEVIRFGRENYPEVEIAKLSKSMYTLAVEKGMLPSMTVRYCCAEYKELKGAGKVTLIGIRKKESARRAKRHEVEISSRKFSGTEMDFEKYREQLAQDPKMQKHKKDGEVMCIRGKESLLISPIFDWTDKDVWEFLNDVVKVPHCKLYDQGRTRIGCVMCPMSSYKNKLRDIAEYPHVKHRWIKAIMDIRRGGGITTHRYTANYNK